MKQLKLKEFIIKISDNGTIVITEGQNQILIGNVNGLRFQLLEQAVKVAKDFYDLNEWEVKNERRTFRTSC